MILLALARHLPRAASVAGEFFDSPSFLKQLRMQQIRLILRLRQIGRKFNTE